MGRRRRGEQGPGQEELLVAAGGAATSTKAPGNVGDHLLTLQQTHGNRAVTTIVQRKGSKAASTDAPGYKKPKPGPKAKAEVSFVPDPDPTITGSEIEMREAAENYWKRSEEPVRVWRQKAVHLYEQLWLRAPGPAKDIAMNIARLHKELGDAKRYDWWMEVHHGHIKPKAPKVEPGSDQHA